MRHFRRASVHLGKREHAKGCRLLGVPIIKIC